MKTAPRPIIVRAFVRDWVGATAIAQRKAANEAGATVIYENAEHRDPWLRSLRSTDVAWVWSLSLLANKDEGDVRPSADFARVIARLGFKIGRGLVLIEGQSGTRIETEADLDKIVPRAAAMVAAGRNLTPSRARAMGERGRNAAIERSAAFLLKKPEVKALIPTLLAVWRSREYGHRDEAAAAVNAMLKERNLPELGSAITIYRVFGKRSESTNKPSPTRKTWVYFIKEASRNRVKIGYSSDVSGRLRGLGHPLLGKMRVLAKIPGGPAEERELHIRFADYRINGEWFRLEGKLAAYIDALSEEGRRKGRRK